MTQLGNKYLKASLSPACKIDSISTFRYRILPIVVEKMNREINNRLTQARYITLVVDCWTSQLPAVEYLGLAAQCINSRFEKRMIIVGMQEIIGGHSAENIKIAIENIVNKFTFNKTKIKGIFKSIHFYLLIIRE